jgi:hypothetical protein
MCQNASDRHVGGGGDENENENENTDSKNKNSIQEAPPPRRWIYDFVDGTVARHLQTKMKKKERRRTRLLMYRNGNNVDLHVFYVIHHHY